MLIRKQNLTLLSRRVNRVYAAKTTFYNGDDSEQHKKFNLNIKSLNNMFYNNSKVMSGEELSIRIKSKFGQYYKADIIKHNNSKVLRLVNEVQDIPDIKHFNKLAEEISESGSSETVRRCFLHMDVEIKQGAYIMEIPI